MTSATPGRAAVLLFAAVLVPGACQPRAETVADPPPRDALAASAAPPPTVPVAMDPTADGYGVDTRRLSLDQPGEQVLVTSKGQKFITVSEYNAWLGTYPLAITSEDQATARKQAVDQMVSFKLLAERARQSGYARPGSPENEKSTVLAYIRDQLSNVSTVTNDQAREYLARHQEYFAPLESAEVSEEIKLSIMKSAVLGERLTERLKGWQDEADLGYAPDVGPPPAVEVSR